MAKGYANLDTDMPAVARATGGTTQDLTYYKPYFEKGNVSQLVVLSIFILGVIITFAAPEGSNTSEFGEYVMSFGLFGFAGVFSPVRASVLSGHATKAMRGFLSRLNRAKQQAMSAFRQLPACN